MTMARLMTAGMMACIMMWTPAALAAAQCDIPERKIEGEYAGEMSEAFQGFVMENSTGLAQDYFAQKLIDSYMTKATNADGVLDSIIFNVQGEVVEASNNWVHVLKAATIGKAIASGEVEPIAGWVQDEVVERSVDRFLQWAGASSSVPVAGILVTGLKIVKESYDELEVQDCLTNIDTAYYNFLEDDRLRTDEDGKIKKGAVDAYIKDYLFGGGEAPGGTTRAQNRRNLQCYINNTLPESERVELSNMGADANEPTSNPITALNRIFNTIGDVAGSAADVAPGATRLRTPIAVMLRDFNNRYDIELEARKIQRLRQSPEYKQFEATIDAMQVSAKAAAWLCDRLGSKEAEDLAGNWELQMVLHDVAGENEFPINTFNFSVPENGLVLTKKTTENDELTLEGTVEDDKADFDVLVKGFDSDSNRMETVLNADMTGNVTGDTMAGEFAGQSIDWGCVFSGMFSDDDSTSVTCGMVPAKGTWTAVKQ